MSTPEITNIPDPINTPEPNNTDLATLGHDVGEHMAERLMYQRATRLVAWFLGGLALLALLIGWLVAGLPGVWAALIGVGLTALFCGGTLWSVSRTIGSAPVSMAATVMLTWLVKLAILIAVLFFLRGRTFYNAYVLFAVVAVGVIGALIVQGLSIKRSNLPYVVPNTRNI